MTIWSSTQNPHILRSIIAAMTGLGQDQVRAIAPEVGGGFGAKINIYGEEYVAAAISKRLGIAGQVDRGSLGGLRRHDARPRHPRLRRSRGQARRHGARPEAAADRRHRRLQHAAHGGHPDADDDDGERDLQHPGDPHDAHRGLHQQDADRCLSRRRPSGGDLLRRARDGHAGARAEDGSGRAAPQELHPAGPVSVRDADGRGLRLGRLREGARPGAEERRTGSS